MKASEALEAGVPSLSGYYGADDAVNVNDDLCPYSDLDEHKNKTHGGLSVTCAIQCSRGEMIKKTIHEGM